MLQITTVYAKCWKSQLFAVVPVLLGQSLNWIFKTEALSLAIVLRHKRAVTIVHSCVCTLLLVHQCGNTDLSKLSEDEEWNLEAASSTVKKYYKFSGYVICVNFENCEQIMMNQFDAELKRVST